MIEQVPGIGNKNQMEMNILDSCSEPGNQEAAETYPQQTAAALKQQHWGFVCGLEGAAD